MITLILIYLLIPYYTPKHINCINRHTNGYDSNKCVPYTHICSYVVWSNTTLYHTNGFRAINYVERNELICWMLMKTITTSTPFTCDKFRDMLWTIFNQLPYTVTIDDMWIRRYDNDIIDLSTKGIKHVTTEPKFQFQ